MDEQEQQQFYTIILRHDTSTEWMVNNPVLALGEYGVEDDTHRVKRGNGKDQWSDLYYETFGIEYFASYSAIQGDPYDNEPLATALNSKISKESFKDGQLISKIVINSETEGTIAEIVKTNLDLETDTEIESKLIIQSSDNSINGIWNITEEGVKVLDLTSKTVINTYTPSIAYEKGQVCIYDNSLIIAKEHIEPSEEINPDNWTVISTTEAGDIIFDNTDTHLEAQTVEEAIKELDTNLDNVEGEITAIKGKMEWVDYN